MLVALITPLTSFECASDGFLWLAGPGDGRPPGPALVSGRSGCGLGGADEGVRLDLHPVVGELDFAMHRLLPVAGVRAAGDRAAEPLRPFSESAEAVGSVGELEADLLPGLRDAEIHWGWQVAVLGQQEIGRASCRERVSIS